MIKEQELNIFNAHTEENLALQAGVLKLIMRPLSNVPISISLMPVTQFSQSE